jgi:hypothetical protein
MFLRMGPRRRSQMMFVSAEAYYYYYTLDVLILTGYVSVSQTLGRHQWFLGGIA